ncbi:MAG: M20/M25/M40 family metallo-hydrolase [Bacteroidetes bacterium]|nr:M20/M25/M40 family metallo-hydrolase [Bacteroidota bacterium]MCW5896317.1 M20/M25/M40 family metallo-hydrolase [Bacteroidota bacterium]
MKRTAFLLVATVSFFPASFSQSPEITVDELKAHVHYLASDELEGRGSGTEGNRKAAEYLKQQFASYGLNPAGKDGSFLQEFEFVSAVKLGPKNTLSISAAKGARKKYDVDKDFRPLGFSSNTAVTGAVVFAGYGISAPEKEYDDYTDIDVAGKIVVALRYGPDGNDIHSDLYRFTSFRNKARYAREKGAAALIIVDQLSEYPVKLSYDQSHSTSGIPCISVRKSVLEELLAPLKRDLGGIQESIKANRRPATFDIPGVIISLETEVIQVMSRTANVLGYVEGTTHKDEVVVIGAHFDHLGYGGEGSGSLQPDVIAIHNGADDNASGTAALLEIAQKFAASNNPPTRTVLFIGFSGEELGTLGSQYYTNNPYFPLNQTVAMLNMDMIGRMKENTLTVHGVGTSPVWNDVVKKWNTAPDTMSIRTVADGFGPSDHASFYTKDIPVLFFFTGTHSDYHKPSDDWDKLNYEDKQRIAHYIYNIANDVQSMTPRPQFTKAQSTASAMGGGDGRGFSVTLGVVPDYAADVKGMKIDGTRAGGPGEKAGLQAGDIITMLGGKKILNIYDYMGILGELKVGQVVEIEITRDGKPMTLSATMTKR